MTDDSQKEVQKAIRDFAYEQRGKADSIGEFNLKLTADYLKEQSYLPSNLYISLNAGILSISSFVLTGKDLNTISKYLALLLLGSIVAIVIEILIRKKFLMILDKDAWERMGHADHHTEGIGKVLQEHCANDPIQCSPKFASLAKELNEKLHEQHDRTNGRLRIPLMWRKTTETLSVLSLLSLMLIVLSELEYIHNLISFMTWFSADYLNAAGLILNLIAAVVLAFAIKVIDPLEGTGSTMKIGGHKQTLTKVNPSLFRLGLALLFLGFFAQLAAIFVV